MVTLQVKVVPGARRSKVVGMLGEALKVQVAAPPERGRANDALVEVLAEFFAVPRRQIAVIAGHTQPRKTVAIEGVDPSLILAKLAALR